MRPKLLGTLALLALVLVFAIQNVEVVEVRFLAWSLEISRALLLFVVFLLGGAAGWLARGGVRRRS